MSFRIGDTIRFKTSDENHYDFPDTYKIFKIVQGYSAPLIYFILLDGTKSGGYYDYRLVLAEPQTPRDKYQDVIDKIKYLDKRYHDRRASV